MIALKICAWWPATGGLWALFKHYSLSAAGDFVAGVVAVPAFAWFILAYYTQRAELAHSVRTLATQTRLMAQELDMLAADRDAASDPHFIVHLSADYPDGHHPWLVPLRAGQVARTPERWLLHIANTGKPVTGFRAIFNTPMGPYRDAASEEHDNLQSGGIFLFYLPYEAEFPCEGTLLITFQRRTGTAGAHRFVMNARGAIVQVYRDETPAGW